MSLNNYLYILSIRYIKFMKVKFPKRVSGTAERKEKNHVVF